MKKLLVLALVLAVSTVASATVLWSSSYVAASKVISITLSSDEAIGGFTFGSPTSILTAGTTGTWSGFDVAAGFDNSLTKDGIASTNKLYSVVGATNPGNSVTGNLFVANFTITGVVPASVTFTTAGGANYVAFGAANQTNFSNVGLGSFTVPTPEPVTVALLGLGGLFIRRRKVA